MVQDNEEFMRIYYSVLQDLEKWNGKEPIEEFFAKILEKRLLVDRNEAEHIAQQILSGIGNYKKAKEFLKNNPQLLKKVTEETDKNLLNRMKDEVIKIFESLKRSLRDGG